MNGLLPLLKKEIREQIKTYRLVIVGGVFLLFGISTPLTLKYLPEIMKLAGEDMVISMPPPTAAQSLIEYTSTIGQIGVLVAILVSMGSIANEVRHGTIYLTLSKPVSRAAFVNAKLIAFSLTFFVSLVVASAICYGYTVWLIEDASIAAFTGANLLLMMFLVFCLAATIFFSSLFRSSLAAGGIALAAIVGQGAISAIPAVGDYLPGKLLGWSSNLINGTGEPYWWALGITAAVTVLCLLAARRRLSGKDL